MYYSELVKKACNIMFEAHKEEGFSDATIEALKYLTHPEGMPYMDYVRRLAVNPIAVKVKLADLDHNMDTRRRDGFQSPKLELYREAKAFLESL